MKKKTKNKILAITTSALLTLAVGGVLLVANEGQHYVSAKAYSYDESTHVMTLTLQDLALTYTEWADNLDETALNDFQVGYITYNSNTVSIDEITGSTIAWDNFDGINIKFELDGANKGKWLLNDDTEWEYGITITNAVDLEQAYVQPPQPEQPSMGSSIINAIKSGLGLIGDLASEFLLGFSTLFWDSTGNTLTQFGVFSLVMLGVAICFSVISLCLNILRSNTGA